MPAYDLKSDEGLRGASATCLDQDLHAGSRQTWIGRLADTFDWVRRADEATRRTRDFQVRLWEDNGVAALGQGKIPLDRAFDDEGFRTWLAKRSLDPLPDARSPRIEFLTAFYEELIERLEQLCNRTPHLKIFRVLAALYPGHFTTIADRGALSWLYSSMGGPRGATPVGRHIWILERLEAVLGRPRDGNEGIAERIALPWILYARFVRDSDDVFEPDEPSGDPKLVPLPATRRRRGLTALGGGFASILSILDFVRDGVTRDELMDFLRSQSPDSKQSSLGVSINVLQSEFAVIRRDGDKYVLTERGSSVLESQDPDNLADWLLTHILGVDHVFAILRDEGPKPLVELRSRLQRVNPGWTSTYAPSSILHWLRSFRLIQTMDSGPVALTDTGRDWADQIHWKPEALPKEDEEIEPSVGPTPANGPVLPPFAAILSAVTKSGHFDATLIARLHAGIWANKRRHFAVLTGLSGSGKTLLAREYARALAPPNDGSPHVLTLPVQPGWYDPGPLLGYVNPLRGESYVSTPFLEFLLRACRDVQRPHVVVLDEMNLSHPEQYMAPLLSAMETGDRIELHTEGDHFDGVPGVVEYPSNLVLIGTVNMDETTHGLSDKVLDRAFTLEFWDIDLSSYPRWGTRTLSGEEERRLRTVLEDLIVALSPARLHFGWRVVDDISDFLSTVKATGAPLPFEDAMDSVICAKVVPKLRGDDSPRIRDAMDNCIAVLKKHALPESLTRVEELRRDIEATGSARYWR